MTINAQLLSIVQNQPYPLLFATISGAHLYGFPSPDSDYDLRGCHILPLTEAIGLYPPQETIEVSSKKEGLETVGQASCLTLGLELDLVTHDVKKFFSLLLKRNGYVLEQLYSPLIVYTTPEHQTLKIIAKDCITRHHVHHYRGFAQTQWKLFEKENPRRVKPLLYVYRVFLTGIYLMQTGRVEANLVKLNEIFNLSYIPDLIDRKLTGKEKSLFENKDITFYRQEYERLDQALELAFQQSHLSETPSAKADLNHLLLKLRMR